MSADRQTIKLAYGQRKSAALAAKCGGPEVSLAGILVDPAFAYIWCGECGGRPPGGQCPDCGNYGVLHPVEFLPMRRVATCGPV